MTAPDRSTSKNSATPRKWWRRFNGKDFGMDVSTTAKRTRTEQCQRNAQAKSEQKRRTAFDTVTLLQREGKPVTKAAVAKRAGVSVVFLRAHPDLVQAIE